MHLSTEPQSHGNYCGENWFLYLAADLGPVLVDSCNVLKRGRFWWWMKSPVIKSHFWRTTGLTSHRAIFIGFDKSLNTLHWAAPFILRPLWQGLPSPRQWQPIQRLFFHCTLGSFFQCNKVLLLSVKKIHSATFPNFGLPSCQTSESLSFASVRTLSRANKEHFCTKLISFSFAPFLKTVRSFTCVRSLETLLFDT